jgi:hypothetical protein
MSLEATKGLEPLSTGLQDRRSDSHLSYIAKRIADLRFQIADLMSDMLQLVVTTTSDYLNH